MVVSFITFGIVLTILGVGLVSWALISFKKKRLIENIPTSKIRSIAMGLVEIYGDVVPEKDAVLKSPFSQTDCVYYKYKIDELRSTGKSTHWVTIKKDRNYRNFYLEDETGMVLVNPKDATIDIPVDNVFKSSLGKDPPYAVKQFLEKEQVAFEGFLFGINKTMRYTESFIAPTDKLYIMGTATDNPYVKEASVVKGVEDVMITKGTHEKFYYISDKHERVIVRNLTLRVVGGFVGGFLCMIFGLLLVMW